jgi:hypothetical protein
VSDRTLEFHRIANAQSFDLAYSQLLI